MRGYCLPGAPPLRLVRFATVPSFAHAALTGETHTRSHAPRELRPPQFHLIDAMGSLSETQEQIEKELRYQSSLDLSEDAYGLISNLPLARDLQQQVPEGVQAAREGGAGGACLNGRLPRWAPALGQGGGPRRSHAPLLHLWASSPAASMPPPLHPAPFQARQQLVGRLEGYAARQRPLFARVLAALRSEVLPLLRQGGLSGRAEWATRDALFTDHPVAVDMLLDVLTDRGFQASCAKEAVDVPVRFDAASGAIETEARPLHRFTVRFETAGVRDGTALKVRRGRAAAGRAGGRAGPGRAWTGWGCAAAGKSGAWALGS
jgi:hypothetical protein